MAAAVTHEWSTLESQAARGGSEALAVIEGRLSPTVIGQLLATGLDRAEIHAIVLPARTLQHRRSRKEDLTIEESDRVFRLLRVLTAAEQVMGSRSRALAWLRRPNPRLDPATRGDLFAPGSRSPMQLLNTETGARIVEELLLQIDEGIYL
jgi:putative toxin-antitoxin system antitoxin component (TIGR02293 family)